MIVYFRECYFNALIRSIGVHACGDVSGCGNREEKQI